MNMTNDEYRQYSDSHQPRSKCLGNCLKAFLVGGLICCIGEAILSLYIHCGLGKTEASSATSATLVFLGALLTGLGLYDRIARFAGGGTLVPITGFANSMVAPALEFKTEGFISGTAAKMFIISGPVIVYGITASVIYGLIHAFWEDNYEQKKQKTRRSAVGRNVAPNDYRGREGHVKNDRRVKAPDGISGDWGK